MPEPVDRRRSPRPDGAHLLITGGNSGVGFEAARSWPAGRRRDPRRTRHRQGRAGRRARSPVGAEVRRLDLADLDSVREFAGGLNRRAVDVLINNAGVMAVPRRPHRRRASRLQFGTNHLGHFALTNLLLPHVTDRVVTVSSGAHRRAHRPRRPQLGAPAYSRWRRLRAVEAGQPAVHPRARSAGSPPPARRCGRWPRTRATRRPTCRAAPATR